MIMQKYVKTLAKQAKENSYKLAALTSDQKNAVLLKMADYIIAEKEFILKENKKDVAAALKNKLQKSFIDRLSLNEQRINEMASGLREVAGLADPVNSIISQSRRPNGISIKKVRVPIGVILIIYEARPNVTCDCIGLLFKSSNVAILRGGSDAIRSNLAIAKVLEKAIKERGVNFNPFFVVEKTGYSVTDALLAQDKYIDLVIPRGGESLIRKVVEKSRIPVLKHYKGVCHLFIDKDIDTQKALKICVNSKVQRPSVCNAVEKILIHQDVAKSFLPLLKNEFDKYRVEIRADTQTAKIIKGVKKATEKDWFAEYLDLIIAIKVVRGIDEAISHINKYGSHHTDSIITNDTANAEKFIKEVDSACCFVNISTRFSDGYQFGLGAEIGISTDKLHARGPMGLEELTTYKWVAEGDGQIRE
ncbi:MAG: glutamate-5-semialdehyde dehydrogenase [Candidatus Omnitrophica bacterium]|nr:glutamate-5-semialdehyde dehydrogenase [Candidatus Omnitrophota bacterium]